MVVFVSFCPIVSRSGRIFGRRFWFVMCAMDGVDR